MKDVKHGKYKHYKGGTCEVVGVARRNDTSQRLVVYKISEAGQNGLWVRPINEFTGTVEVDGQKILRYTYAD